MATLDQADPLQQGGPQVGQQRRTDPRRHRREQPDAQRTRQPEFRQEPDPDQRPRRHDQQADDCQQAELGGGEQQQRATDGQLAAVEQGDRRGPSPQRDDRGQDHRQQEQHPDRRAAIAVCGKRPAHHQRSDGVRHQADDQQEATECQQEQGPDHALHGRRGRLQRQDAGRRHDHRGRQ
ncbi:MAG: hypothetical protein WED12_03845 [Chloroflexota bacterium]